jgi:lysophospholipase L1-like esterase
MGGRSQAVRACALALALLQAACAHGRGAEPTGAGWVATWAASPQSAGKKPLHVEGQTLRQVVRISLGGGRVRLRLSNAYGAAALRIGAAHLALVAGTATSLAEQGPSIAPGSDRVLTFGGSSQAMIPPGALIVSDPVPLEAPALAEVVVSLFLPGPVDLATQHDVARATTWLSSAGDFTAAATLAPSATRRSWYVIAGVEAEAPAGAAAVVALGDSITDGLASTLDANHRFPDFLAGRLRPSGRAVVNAGISGNRVIDDLGGVSALARFDRDVLAQPGARYVLFTEGINDVGMDSFGEDVPVERIIEGHRQIILRAHAAGLRIFAGTIAPYGGATSPLRFSELGERKRQALNQWIRTGGEYDAVIDFDAVLRDPADPSRLSAKFDSGDHIHPNDAGYEAMAAAVDLSLFTGS